jgi:oligopeptide/dipeptide ABC transporter ATP-binding protein
VVYGGRVVEEGPAGTVVSDPAHPYTAALLGVLPRRGARRRELPVPIPGRPPSLHDRNAGCPFAPRCGHAADQCRDTTPEPLEVVADRLAACHHLPLAVVR